MLLNYICGLVYVLGISLLQETKDILQNKDQGDSAPQPVIEAKHISQFKTSFCMGA